MAAIRSKDSRAEIYVRRAIHRAGFRFRLHRRDLPGNPDITLPRFRTAVFVDGCFWHAHSCSDGHIPKSNESYWAAKIAKNAARDSLNRAALAALGWTITTIPECELGARTSELLDALRIARESADV